MSTIGPLVDSGQIEADVLRTLQTWLPTYLLEAVAQAEHDPIAAPASWAIISQYDRWPEQGLPAVIVVSPGIIEDSTRRDGEGFYRATWAVEVSVTVAAAKSTVARRMAQIYGAAVRGALLQRRSLGHQTQVTDWINEEIGGVNADKRRTVCVVANAFHVERADVVTTQGPTGDEPPAPGSWPIVNEATVEVTKR